MKEVREYAIIGGGISGLSALHFLKKAGKDVVLIDKGPLGGKINTIHVEGNICENGPNTVMLRENIFYQLIKELELESELVFSFKENSRNRFIRNRKGIIPLPKGPLSMFSSSLLSGRDKLRLITLPFAKALGNLEELSVYDYFQKRFGESLAHNIAEPFVTGIYAGNAKSMSFRYAFAQIYNYEKEHGNVFRGFLKNRKNNPKSKGLITFKNGLDSLAKRILEIYKDSIVESCEVKDIIKGDQSYDILTNAKADPIKAKVIIDTRPIQHLNSSLLKSNSFPDVSYSPVLVMHLLINENIRIPKGFGMLTTSDSGRAYLGVLFNSMIFPHVSKNGNLITVISGGARCAAELKENPELFKKKVIEDVEEDLGLGKEYEILNEFYWSEAIPQYGFEQEELRQGIKAFEKSNSNYHLLGNYFDGVAIGDRVEAAHKLTLELLKA